MGLVQHHVRGPAAEGVRFDLLPALGGRSVDVTSRRPIVVAGVVVVAGRSLHPASVDIERARSVGEHVRGDGALDGLAGDDDGLERGFERSAPTFPLAGGVRRGGRDVEVVRGVTVAALRLEHPERLAAAHPRLLGPDDLALCADELSARALDQAIELVGDVKDSLDRGPHLRAGQLLVLPVPTRTGRCADDGQRHGGTLHALCLAVGADDLSHEGNAAVRLIVDVGPLVDGLGHVERLREPAVPGGEDQPIASGDERAVRDGDAPHHSGIVHDVCRDAGRRQEAPSSIFPHS